MILPADIDFQPQAMHARCEADFAYVFAIAGLHSAQLRRDMADYVFDGIVAIAADLLKSIFDDQLTVEIQPSRRPTAEQDPLLTHRQLDFARHPEHVWIAAIDLHAVLVVLPRRGDQS